MIRTLWAYTVGILSTAYFSVMVNVHFVLKTGSWEAFAERAPARWAAMVMRASGVRTVWENAHFLGVADRAQILVANHQSWFDVFALAGTLPMKFSFVGKKELARIPIFGTAWARVGHYAIDRSDHQAAVASLQRAGERIKSDNTTVVMFPEGTRSPTGELARFKKGAFILAINAQVPVIPVAVLGTRRIMPKGRWFIRPGTVTIRVAHPIPTQGLELAHRDRLTRQAREAVAGLMNGGDAEGATPSGEGAGEGGRGLPPEKASAAKAGAACRPS